MAQRPASAEAKDPKKDGPTSEEKPEDKSGKKKDKEEKDDKKKLLEIIESEMSFGRKNKQKKEQERYPWWETQPVPKMDESKITENNWIEAPKDPAKDVRQTPYDLLAQFEWCEPNIENEAEIKAVYELLNQNYVEDDDNMFRFDYSIPFLQCLLDGGVTGVHVAVRTKATGKLVAFITAVPAHVKVYDKEIDMVEINFLCVHKKLRSKGLAPLLISEITRRVNVTNRWQAVYTAGVVLPKPVSKSRYFHRSLNPKKLIEVGFSHLAPRMTLKRTLRLYQLPEATVTPGLRPMTEADCETCLKLLLDYLKAFDLWCVFTLEEFKHWFLPRPNVMESYVVEDPETKKVTDFFSFYALPSTVIGHEKHKVITLSVKYCRRLERPTAFTMSTRRLH